jgi:hypothetical protein
VVQGPRSPTVLMCTLRLRSFTGLHPTPRTPRVVGTEVPCAESLVALRESFVPGWEAPRGLGSTGGDARRDRPRP